MTDSAYRVLAAMLLFLIAASSAAWSQPLLRRPGGQRDTTLLPVPGGLSSMTEAQDSAYQRALELPLRPDQKLELTIRSDSAAMVDYLDSLRTTPEAIMHRNLSFSAQDWQPTDADKKRREADIWRSQDFDYVFGGRPYLPIFSVSTAAIFRALGLIEDVTPNINYTVASTQNVTVIVYNLSAIVVNKMVDGVQHPGVYKLVWNMLDRNGKRAPSGDYVAEVIVGTTLMLRKRIEVP